MVYGYCRVSTKGQAKDGNSIEAQEAAVREALLNLLVHREYSFRA